MRYFLLTFCFALLHFALGLSLATLISYKIYASSGVHAADDITSLSLASRTVDELTKTAWARASSGTVHTTGLVKKMA